MPEQIETKKADSRNKILMAATNLFGRRGYRGTTIDDITKASGISRGAMYWHFKGKSDLLGAVIGRLREEYLTPFREKITSIGGRPIDRLWNTFKFNASFALEHRNLVDCLRTLSLELSPSESEQEKAFFDILKQQRSFINDIIKDAQVAGEIRSDIDAGILTSIFLAIHDGAVLQHSVFGNLIDGRELAWGFRQVTLAGMAPGARVIHPRKPGTGPEEKIP
jgi:AcrR family transcriptional regulator